MGTISRDCSASIHAFLVERKVEHDLKRILDKEQLIDCIADKRAMVASMRSIFVLLKGESQERLSDPDSIKRFISTK